jgi:predicted dithiol-disulfide oxidoreductase (DUF899 family)
MPPVKKRTEFQRMADALREARKGLPWCSAADAYAQAFRSLQGITASPQGSVSLGGYVCPRAKRRRT